MEASLEGMAPSLFFDFSGWHVRTENSWKNVLIFYKSLESRMTISSGEPKSQPRNSSVGRLKAQIIKMLFATRYHWRTTRCGEPTRPPVPVACKAKECRTDYNTNECRVNQHGDPQRKSDHLDH
jgi:hypothetical protein